MSSDEQITLSDRVELADWVRARLSPPEQHIATSIVPAGFEAYARILHPAQEPDGLSPLVRWADVSAWSGLPLHGSVQWPDISLPRATPTSAPPWRSQGPREGRPFDDDVSALVEVLTTVTSTPDQCVFCLWLGRLTSAVVMYSSPDVPAEQIPPPPRPVRILQLPWREYALFEGPVSSALSFGPVTRGAQRTANLWWPADHAWAVSSEIDLPWTYVGGPASLIEALVSDDRLEALQCEPSDSCLLVLPGWLLDLVDRGVDELISTGVTTLALSLGAVEATFRPSRPLRPGIITASTRGPRGESSHQSPIRSRDAEYVRASVHSVLRGAVLDLVGH